MVYTETGLTTLKVKERHEIEMRKSFIPGLGRDGYFVSWKRPTPLKEGETWQTYDHIQLESYRAEPPGPSLRYITESKHRIGIYRIVKDDDGKWYIELLEEDPPAPERLKE